jgi:hypothetical protein
MVIIGADVIYYFMQSRETNSPSAYHRPALRKISSDRWNFSALLPEPVEQKRSSINTSFGIAPLEIWEGDIGPVRYTIAVAEYSPRVAAEFSEQARYDSAAKETPKFLGGKLVRNDRINSGDIEGREKVIVVEGKATLHSREFLVGNRSYQIQIASVPGCGPNAADEARFLNSLSITYRPAKN